MQTRQGCLELVERVGLELLDDFVLPQGDWAEYYEPMQERLHRLTNEYAGDERALRELAEHQREIDVWRGHGEEYGYVFLIAKKP